MGIKRVELSERVKQLIAECEANVRQIMYGESCCPVWGTSFAEIESIGMSVGEELSRRFMALAAEVQSREMPPNALVCEGEQADPAGTETRSLVTEAGPIQYETPRAYLPKSRRAFFPSGESAGDGVR
jgi:hypothetical protein